MAGVFVVVGGVVLYLRFVRGWKFADMMYVTKGALTSMQESVNSSEPRPRAWGPGGGGGAGRGSCGPAHAAGEFYSPASACRPCCGLMGPSNVD